MPATTLQRKLVLDDAPTLVLATIAHARLQLPGHDEDDILALIQEGALLWSWNIALRPKVSAAEYRIWPDCITHYKATSGSRPYGQLAGQPKTIEALVDQLVPEKPFLWSTTIRLLLNCGPEHVTNLIDAKCLKCLPLTTGGALYRRGPGGAACIKRESFIQFLKTRLEGAS
jgi:hypothetical protein